MPCDVLLEFVEQDNCYLINGIRSNKILLALLDKERVAAHLAQKLCKFIMNVPNASHMGGVWERHIKTVRSILSSFLLQSKGAFE